MGMPFVLIFSLILVIVALVVGFWAIKNFLERAEQAAIYDFKNQLENEIIGVWQTEEASKTLSLPLSKKFEYVCFSPQNCQQGSGVPDDFCDTFNWYKTDDENLFLYPGGVAEKYDANTAWHIKCGTKDCLNIEKTTCFRVENGKVSIKLIKESGSPFVTVSKP